MKHPAPILLAGLVLASTLSSCVVAPGPVAARHPHSLNSPGGRFVTPGERYVHSPRSPGGRYVTPRERYAMSPRSPGGSVVLPREARPVVHGGVTYHTHNGLWYRPSGRGYVIVARPY